MMRCTHALRSLQTDHAAGTPLCLCAANSVSTRTRRHIREVHDGDGAVLKLDLDAALRFDEVPDQALVMLTQRRTTTHNDAQRRTTTHNDAQRRTTTHNDAQRRTTTHSEAEAVPR